MGLIVHITTREEWQKARAEGVYEGDALRTEGFIHCSRPEQLIRVADALFRAQTGLVLLVIDPACVTAEIRDEPADGEGFPHIYGPLNDSAVTAVVSFEPNGQGCFSLPPELERSVTGRPGA